MAAPKRSSFGTRLLVNFSTYHCIFLAIATTEEQNKREILVVGRSGCGLSINMKYVGKGMNAVKNCGYFAACNAVVMLKIEARSVCPRMRGCSLARATNNDRPGTEFCSEWQKRDFCCFSMTLKTVIFVLVQTQTLIFCKKWLTFLCLLGISV